MEDELSEAEVLRMAQRYLSRRAASSLQLRQMLMRKLERRFAATGGERPEQSTVENVVDRVLRRIAEAGLIDEAALAQSRADTLVQKGLSLAGIRRRLVSQGLDPQQGPIEALATADDERQARRYIRRKRLGAWHSGSRGESLARDMRSLARAGFSMDLARRMLQEGQAVEENEP